MSKSLVKFLGQEIRVQIVVDRSGFPKISIRLADCLPVVVVQAVADVFQARIDRDVPVRIDRDSACLRLDFGWQLFKSDVNLRFHELVSLYFAFGNQNIVFCVFFSEVCSVLLNMVHVVSLKDGKGV